jgi:hypothetical protein
MKRKVLILLGCHAVILVCIKITLRKVAYYSKLYQHTKFLGSTSYKILDLQNRFLMIFIPRSMENPSTGLNTTGTEEARRKYDTTGYSINEETGQEA